MIDLVLSSAAWGEDDEDDEAGDVCSRCGETLTRGHCTDVTINFAIAGAAEWFWCDDCADAFTAWRLACDDVIVRRTGGQP